MNNKNLVFKTNIKILYITNLKNTNFKLITIKSTKNVK